MTYKISLEQLRKYLEAHGWNIESFNDVLDKKSLENICSPKKLGFEAERE